MLAGAGKARVARQTVSDEMGTSWRQQHHPSRHYYVYLSRTIAWNNVNIPIDPGDCACPEPPPILCNATPLTTTEAPAKGLAVQRLLWNLIVARARVNETWQARGRRCVVLSRISPVAENYLSPASKLDPI
jgi:hypothetical protein